MIKLKLSLFFATIILTTTALAVKPNQEFNLLCESFSKKCKTMPPTVKEKNLFRICNHQTITLELAKDAIRMYTKAIPTADTNSIKEKYCAIANKQIQKRIDKYNKNQQDAWNDLKTITPLMLGSLAWLGWHYYKKETALISLYNYLISQTTQNI